MITRRNFLPLILVTLSFLCVHGQILDDSAEDRRHQRENLPKGIQETLQRRKIEEEKKDFNQLLQRGEEAISLSEEILSSYSQNNFLTEEDRKKLEKIEKSIRRIRDYLGGEEDGEEKTEVIRSLKETLESLRENSERLLSILKKTSRYSISVTAIEISNNLIKTIRAIMNFLRK